MDILKNIKKLWSEIDRDPKILAFKEKLALEKPVKEGKSIIFTESKETAQYLLKNLQEVFPDQIIYFSGDSSQEEREIVMQNFDASALTNRILWRNASGLFLLSTMTHAGIPVP